MSIPPMQFPAMTPEMLQKSIADFNAMLGIGPAQKQVKHVIFSAPVFTESGYGVHARQIGEWLLSLHKSNKIKLSVHAVPWGDTPWILDGRQLNGLIGELQQLTIPPSTCDVSVQLKLPNEWDPKMGRVNIGMTAGVESDRCNPEWVKACNTMSCVVVPSQHVKKTLESSGRVTTEIFVIGESYPKSIESHQYSRVSSALDGLETNFNFLVFGQLTGDAKSDRKNTFNTINAISEAFTGDSSVGIILKTNFGRNTKIDREATMAVLSRALGKRNPKAPKISVFHGSMSENEVTSLMTHPNTRALVSLTRGEGWGLPLLEAAAVGLPIIATDWSGHKDFLDRGKFVKINYTLSNVPREKIDANIFVTGAKWAEPSIDDAKRKLLKFRASPELPKKWAEELSVITRKEYSHSKISNDYDSALGRFFS